MNPQSSEGEYLGCYKRTDQDVFDVMTSPEVVYDFRACPSSYKYVGFSNADIYQESANWECLNSLPGDLIELDEDEDACYGFHGWHTGSILIPFFFLFFLSNMDFLCLSKKFLE